MTHTRDEIMALDADGLNEAIYRAQGYEKMPYPFTPHWQKPESVLFFEPKYSTEIRAAWELVEEAKLLIVPSWEGWAVGTGPNSEFISGNTAPLAICRAWLLWKAAQCS